MSIIKRTVCFVIAMLCVLLTFVSCKNDISTNTGAAREVTVWSSTSHSKVLDEEMVKKFNESTGTQKGIRINYIVKEGAAMTQSLSLALIAGEGPDFFTCGAALLREFAEKNNIIAIDDLKGGAELLEKFKGFRTNAFLDGKTYALPTGPTTRGLIYNKDMFREAGLVDKNGEPTPPKTFDEMREYAKRLTDPSKNKYGIIFPIKWNGWFTNDIATMLQHTVGHSGFDPVTGEVDFSGLAPIMHTFLDIKQDGSYYPGADGIDNDTARALFANGSIGMKISASYDVGVLNWQFPAECDWGVAPLPVVDIENVYRQRLTMGLSYCINATLREKLDDEQILAVLDFFSSDEYAIESYKKGMSLPVFWSTVEGVEPDKNIKGWKEFAQILSISEIIPPEPGKDFGGALPLADRFLTEVWTGKKTPEEVLAQYNIDYTKAVDKYYQNNPNEKKDDLLIPDWNIKR